MNLLHVDVVHLTSSERVGLLSRTSVAISILCFRTFNGVVSGISTLETSNVTHILLGGCRGVGRVLTVASSVALPFTTRNMSTYDLLSVTLEELVINL